MSQRPASQATEDDLSDLDDVLDEFTQPAPSTSRLPETNSKAPDSNVEPDLDAAFMAELTKNMTQMFQSEAQDQPALTSQEEDDFKNFFEQMMRSSAEGNEVTEAELQDTLKEMETRLKAASSSQPTPSPRTPTPQQPTSFQDSVKQTYDKLKASDATARAEEDASAQMANDPLAAMFAQLESSMGIDDPAIQDTLEAMMGQLMSKELLYEPIQDLHSKYPDYLQKHGDQLPPDELARYQKQARLVEQITQQFEAPSYSDDKPELRGKIVGLMQEMQACGAPPAEMMGGLPPGMALGPDGMPALPECPTS